MHDVVSEVLKNTIRKIPLKNLFPVDKSNNYFLLFAGRILINEKNQLQMFLFKLHYQVFNGMWRFFL